MKPSIIEQHGFSWVSLPREGIMPLLLLEKSPEGIFSRIKRALFGLPEQVDALNSDLFDLFPKKGRGSYPKVGDPEATAFFSGHDILNSEAQFNLSGLEAIKEVGSADLEAKIKKAKKRLFSFKEPKKLSVKTEILLEEHLNNFHPTTQAAGFIEKLQNGKIYVVSEVLQTKSFSVRDASDFEISGGVSVEALEGYMASIKASAGHSRDQTDRLGYKGEAPITFALKAYRILYREEEGKEVYAISKRPLASVRSTSGSQIEGEEIGAGIVTID